MCYTGKCPYENYQGDCTRRDNTYPDDAHCVVMEKAQELDAAGLLDDIDIDDTGAILAAFGRMQDALGKLDLEEALGELEGLELDTASWGWVPPDIKSSML